MHGAAGDRSLIPPNSTVRDTAMVNNRPEGRKQVIDKIARGEMLVDNNKTPLLIVIERKAHNEEAQHRGVGVSK